MQDVLRGAGGGGKFVSLRFEPTHLPAMSSRPHMAVFELTRIALTGQPRAQDSEQPYLPVGGSIERSSAAGDIPAEDTCLNPTDGRRPFCTRGIVVQGCLGGAKWICPV